MTTNQTKRVSDEELDQMIWKLERDGMTPKQLSMMRELREVRRAKGEPVAWIVHARTGDQLTTDSGYVANAEGILGLHSTPLYAAPPAPPAYKKTENFTDYHAGWNTCRAAMLQSDGTLTNEDTMQLSDNSEQLEPVSNRDELPTNSFTDAELEMMAHGNNPQANAYRQALAFRRNSPATPDGWIPVSERMPPEGIPLLVCSGNGVVQRTVYGFDGANWLDWYEQYDPVKAEPDDLWQPLPAAPKEVAE